MVNPIADYIEKKISLPVARIRLRPPGAIPEDDFLGTCHRCGACVDICPANAITPMGKDAGQASGTPIIDPDVAACVICEGLQCTHVCPSGALLPLTDPMLINMGLAVVYESACVRSEGEDCTICVDRCPLGDRAIRFEGEGIPTVLSPGCVGCGVCQLYCPTQPKAIVIQPR